MNREFGHFAAVAGLEWRCAIAMTGVGDFAPIRAHELVPDAAGRRGRE
jgi:hypothetical protein